MIIFANISCILCEIALGWVPVNLSQHWFKWYLGAIRQHAIIDQYLSCYIYMWMENLFFLIMVEFSPIFSNFFMKYKFIIIFSCDQAALQVVFSVRLSVRLSHLFDYVPIIGSSWNFQELLPMTKVRSMQKVKVRRQRSRSQRSQPNLTVSGL